MKKFLIAGAMFFATCLAFSQNADKITEILNSSKLTYAQAAYIAQAAMYSDRTEEQAFAALQKAGIIPNDVSASKEITAKEFAYICSSTWQVKGSLMLKMFKNARYTFRQMKVDGVIPKNTDPNTTLNGHEAINIVTNCAEQYEQNIALEDKENLERGGKK